MLIYCFALESCEKESKDDKVLLGEDMSLSAGVQRAEVPTNDLIIKETNMEVAVTILPTTTEMNSTLVNTYFICSPILKFLIDFSDFH